MSHNNGNILLRKALEHIASFGTAPEGISRLVDIGTESYLKYFSSEIIEDLLGIGGATCKFFEGTYGSGKTHIIEILRELSLENRMIVAKTDLSQALKLSDWKMITEHIFQNMEASVDGQILRSLPDILAALDGKNITSNMETLSKANLPCPSFKNAMLCAVKRKLCNEPLWTLIKNYLLGRKILVSDFRKQNTNNIKVSLNHRNAEYVLKTVLAGLYYLGFTGTILLFDENEQTLSVDKRGPSKKNMIAANLMRRMIDGCSNGLMIGTVVVFAILPGFLDNCSRSYPALGQRMQIFRDDTYKPSWRWPVLGVDTINDIVEPEKFLEDSIKKYIDIVKKLGGNTKKLDDVMRENGKSVLENNAGAGYKRGLMKELANIAIERL